MNSTRVRLLACVLLVSTAVGLAGCNERDATPGIVGSWQVEGDVFAFNADGTMTVSYPTGGVAGSGNWSGVGSTYEFEATVSSGVSLWGDITVSGDTIVMAWENSAGLSATFVGSRL